MLRNTKTYRQFFPVSARFLDRISTQFEDPAFFRNRYLQIIAQAATLTLVNCGVILAYSDDCYAGLLRANFAGGAAARLTLDKMGTQISSYSDQAQRLLLVVRSGKFAALAGELSKRMFSNRESYILRRDLKVPFRPAPPKQPIEIRPIRESDKAEILKARPGRLAILRANIPTCYLAVTASGEICYMQWLVEPSNIERFKPFFDGELKNLGKDEVLLEFAYTFEKFRGQKIMGAAMSAIAEEGLQSGARYAVTYVQKDNVAALKGCALANFYPYMTREERWRVFSFTESFRSLPEVETADPRPVAAQAVSKS